MACLGGCTGTLCCDDVFGSFEDDGQALPTGELIGIPGVEIGMNTLLFAPTVIGD